jgi:hypothetical protein
MSYVLPFMIMKDTGFHPKEMMVNLVFAGSISTQAYVVKYL